MKLDLGAAEHKRLANAARGIWLAGEVPGPHAHGYEARCVGTPLHMHAIAKRLLAGHSGGRNGQGERIRPALAAAERDVDPARIDCRPRGALELEPAPQGSVGVVAHQHAELDLDLIGDWVRLERLW
jgi:hypothetical protein